MRINVRIQNEKKQMMNENESNEEGYKKEQHKKNEQMRNTAREGQC